MSVNAKFTPTVANYKFSFKARSFTEEFQMQKELKSNRKSLSN